MRVTFNNTYRDAIADLGAANERLIQLQRQVTTGKKISKPSDDPSAAQGATLERGELATLDRYQQATDSVGSRLSVADTVLSDIVNQLTSARATATGASGSTMTETQRAAAAGEVERVRDALLSDLTTVYRGTFLFAGSAATTAPYERATDGSITAYKGDDRPVSVDIDRHQSVQVSFNGDDLMRGQDAEGLLTTLGKLATAIRTGNSTGIADGASAIGRGFDRAVRMQSRVGNDLRRLDDERTRLQALTQAGTERLAGHEDADLAKAITQMTQAQTAYSAALGATGTISKLSLMDYLK